MKEKQKVNNLSKIDKNSNKLQIIRTHQKIRQIARLRIPQKVRGKPCQMSRLKFRRNSTKTVKFQLPMLECQLKFYCIIRVAVRGKSAV